METYSASRLILFGDCKKKFFHQYILKDLPYESSPFGEMGTAIHKALEIYRKNFPAIQQKDLIEIYNSSFNPPKEFGWLKGQGVSILRGLDYSKVVKGELLALEKGFEIPVEIGENEQVILNGFIDKIEFSEEDSTFYITDYKTNSSPKPKQYLIQLLMYDYATRNLLLDIFSKDELTQFNVKAELFYVRHNKIFRYEFSDDLRAGLIDTVKNVHNYIKENRKNPSVWTKKPKKDSSCSFCPLAKKCWS